jgi:hypothetical protein
MVRSMVVGPCQEVQSVGLGCDMEWKGGNKMVKEAVGASIPSRKRRHHQCPATNGKDVWDGGGWRATCHCQCDIGIFRILRRRWREVAVMMWFAAKTVYR